MSKTVLIADDDPALVRALTVRCKWLGLTVESSSDGLDALTSIVRQPPDLLITDIGMPAADGLSVCEKLAADPNLAPIPVIILTGRTDDETAARCEQLGAHHVPKGLDAWDQLEPLIHRLLGLPTDPAAAGEASTTPTGHDPRPPAEPAPRVLAIDDDPAISKALRIRLGAYGVEVFRALSGMQGFWIALKEQPDVIVTDFRMPEGRGNYILGRLKEHAVTKHIPVIFLTGQTIGGRRDYALERELLSLGAAAFLTKPLDFDSLLTELRRHITLPPAPVASAARRPTFRPSA